MPKPPRPSVQRDEDHHHHPDAKSRHLKTRPQTTRQPSTVRSSLLQPRVAVALNLPAKWHPFLFVCRLLSCLPAAWWGLPMVLGLLAQAHVWYIVETGMSNCSEDSLCLAGLDWMRARTMGGVDLEGGSDGGFERRLRVTEMGLGIVWCFASAYLSFFFTDCLMSRWLLNYTPQATLVRLLTINACNLYLTSWVLHLTGGAEDPRCFLPAWICIATTLTGMYHILQRKINIRKETSMSMSVFSFASFISMAALLAQLHYHRPVYPTVPFFVIAKKAWEEGGKIVVKALEYGNGARLRLDEL